MKSFIIALIILIDVLLETTLFPFITIMGVKPNALLALIAAFAFVDDKKAALIVGAVGGLLEDILFGDVIGIMALLNMAFAYGFIVLRGKVMVDRIAMPALITFDASVVYNLLMGIVFILLRANVSLQGFLNLLIFDGLYTAVVGIISYNVLLWLYSKYRFMNQHSIFSKEK